MTNEEIKAGLTSLEPGHPFVLAVTALLAQEVADEQNGAIQPQLADGSRQFNAGRLAHAVDFQRVFNGVVEQARGEMAERLNAEAQRKE
jgi:hypothetical protein